MSGEGERFGCEGCGNSYRWKAELAGRRVRCKCGHILRVPEAAGVAEPEEAAGLAGGGEEAHGLDLRALAAVEASAEGEAAAGSRCPGCGSPMVAGAVLCVSCGYNVRTGERAGFRGVEREGAVDERADAGARRFALPRVKGGRLGIAVAAGATAAVLSGMIWAGIRVSTGYEIGWVAVGVGLLTGASVMFFADEGSEALGAIAAGLAVCGLVIGKLLIVQWSVYAISDEDLLLFTDTEGMVEAVTWDTARSEGRGDLADEMTRASARAIAAERESAGVFHLSPDDAEAFEALMERAAERIAAMDRSERLSIMRRYVSASFGGMSYAERFKLASSIYDAIWFVLAIGAAYKLGSGFEITRRG